jgi:hypothetical protein
MQAWNIGTIVSRLTQIWALVVMLVACAPTFVYRHADWLILWKVDQYFDLDRQQKVFLRGRLKDLLAGHRKEALPLYERMLGEIKDKTSDGLTREEVDWAFTRYQELRADLVKRIIDDSAIFLASVSEQQLRNLERALQKENRQIEQVVEQETEKRLSQRAIETTEWLEDWLGSLTKDQKRRIREFSYGLPDILPFWLEHQKRRQQQFLQLVRTAQEAHLIAERIREWWLFPEHDASPGYQQRLQQMRTAVKEMALAIDQIVTPQQRAHAQKKLQALIDTIHALAMS